MLKCLHRPHCIHTCCCLHGLTPPATSHTMLCFTCWEFHVGGQWDSRSHRWFLRMDCLGNLSWTAMFCTVLYSIFPYFIFLFRVKDVISISPCNTTDVARAGCFFLPFHCHFPTALELGWRRNPQSTESCSGYPTFVYLFFPSSFSLKLFRPPLKRNGASLERAASQCEKHCFGEREKIHDFKREKHSQFNKRRP